MRYGLSSKTEHPQKWKAIVDYRMQKNDIEVKNLLNIVRVVAGVEFPHRLPTYVIK